MRYFEVKPDVAGGLGNNTVRDRNSQAPGDALLELVLKYPPLRNIDRYSQDLSCRVFARCRCGDVPEQMTLA